MPSMTELDVIRLDDDRIKVSARSILTGRTNEMILNMSLDGFNARMEQCKKGTMIGHCFASLSYSEREFLMTGVTDLEWDTEFLEEREGDR